MLGAVANPARQRAEGATGKDQGTRQVPECVSCLHSGGLLLTQDSTNFRPWAHIPLASWSGGRETMLYRHASSCLAGPVSRKRTRWRKLRRPGEGLLGDSGTTQ